MAVKFNSDIHYRIKTDLGYVGNLVYNTISSDKRLKSYDLSCEIEDAHIFTRDKAIQPFNPEIGMEIQRDLTLALQSYIREELE